ncbi:hypothetical protein SAMN05216354_0604 [Xylanibacter ruminicola]|uniref:Uncharacterized protein n=1 Tax=Xylanibacter ruminicola TaxID=839 RepID=A0A1H5SBQ7_XYLRU|nr:hypothetical protein [Xylanibacter ruminicola]SEF47850.1 hypothetical protein SAMN05216354_0604 [Xylanibacter ruminicola]
MMYDIYTGDFVSRDDIRWTVTIQEDLEVAPESVGVLDFSDEEPLLIEWTETSKENVICGSVATLKIISQGDRTYADLYTIKAGYIGIRIDREGLLYWMGTLDPEFYEEPYTDNEDYEVELTFSDFGIFERLRYNLVGMQTLETILSDALSRARINESINQDWISTRLTLNDGNMALADLSVRSENFTDEDGEVCNMKEVVEGILQPLGLRMTQRNGKVFVYDLNGIFHRAETEKIEWHDDDQMMGVDKVANNATVTFSPYSSSELLKGEIEFGGDYSVEEVNRGNAPGANNYSYYPDYSKDHVQGDRWDYNLISFTIFLSDKGQGLAYLDPAARYFHILPVVSGPSECDGVAWGFYSGGHGSIDEYHHWPKQILNPIGKIANRVLMRTNRVYLPKLSENERDNYYVRLSLEMLLDPRYNPFSSSDDDNEEDNYNHTKAWTGWAFVPVAVTVYDEYDAALCHYVNGMIARSAAVGHLGYARGYWASGAGQFGDAFLEYYNADDLKEDTGIMGWKANRHCIGRPDHESRAGSGYEITVPIISFGRPVIYDSFKQMEDGEYMPYPDEGGYLEVTIFAGANCYDYGESTGFDTTRQWDRKNWYEKMRWLLYKAPKVELVRNNLKFDSEQLDDVEYSGYINKDAKEEISIDTICGTIAKSAPTARGTYFRTSDYAQVTALTREGRTNPVEKLLIGTLYSQFAERHTRLSGTAFLLDGDLKLYTDGVQGQKKFLALSDIQDTDAGTSEAVIVELSPDEYEAIEYKDVQEQ